MKQLGQVFSPEALNHVIKSAGWADITPESLAAALVLG
jgi:hypothetical protein